MGSLYEEEDTSSSARFSRLEHILGGKSRRGVNRLGEGGTRAGEIKLEKATKPMDCDETMLEASTNSCMSDFVHCDDLGLEVAMKQLMEATHDALVNMKGEILRMQYDLQRALVEISLLQQREELLQQQFKGKAVELEKEFSKRIEDLRQTVILEFSMCKHESEKSMLEKLESLLVEMRNIQNNGGKSDKLIESLPDKRFVLERTQEAGQKSVDSNHSSINEISNAKPDDLNQSSEQRAALTEKMLQRISPKRLEQSVAVVRGWLQSPTPSESSTSADKGVVKQPQQQHRLCNVPMPHLVYSVKEEAKLFATHRRVLSPLQHSTKACKLPSEGESMPKSNLDALVDAAGVVHNCTQILPVLTASENGIYKENAAADNCQLTQSFTLATAVKNLPVARAEQCKLVRKERPALRILKPKNFKISDLLVSDSEEEMGQY